MKKQATIWRVPPRLIHQLRVGESLIVGPCRASTVSTEFVRAKVGKFTMRQTILVERGGAWCHKMYLVTRVS